MEKNYICPECQKECKNAGALKRHMEKHMNKETSVSTFICNTCGKSFESLTYKKYCSNECRQIGISANNKKTNNYFNGTAAEAFIASKFLLNGFFVYTPYSGIGPVDLIIIYENQVYKIQVKSSVQFNALKNSCSFSIKSRRITDTGNLYEKCYTEDDVDYFAFVDIITERITIVPISVIETYKGTSIRIQYSDEFHNNGLNPVKFSDYSFDSFIENIKCSHRRTG